MISMIRDIDKDKLKMKHLIGVKTENLVTAEDFLYDMFQAYEEKEWDVNTTSRTQSQLWNAGLKSPMTDLSFSESFERLKENGWISIEEKNGTTYYQIVGHPW